MHCAGYNSDTYDRYVLGLLEEPERSQLEAQIQEQCPACLTGVQRSMNLWLVFAETLENAEPSEDFRGRIVRIAELSRKVLTFPKNSAVRERSSVPISTLVIICAVTCILLVATWYAARDSVRIDRPPALAFETEHAAQNLTDNPAKSEQENGKRPKTANEVDPTGKALALRAKQPDDSLLKAQAEAAHYRNELERKEGQFTDSTSLLRTFAKTGARMLPMKPTEAAVKGLGYVIFAQNSELVFVGSSLPKPSPDHTFELWILRKEEPSVVSAGVFMPSDSGPWVVHYTDASLLSAVTGFVVTEEPIQGEYTKPTGPKLFEVSTVEEN
jgi:anti-sigma-K factor RskA